MPKNDMIFAKAIEYVRDKLSDQGARIVDTPTPLWLAWWPSRTEPLKSSIVSQSGIASGPNGKFSQDEISKEFYAEEKAIHECLDYLGNVPRFAKWQKMRDQNSECAKAARRMYASMNQRAEAYRVWEHIAFPLRRRGDLVFRISTPIDVGLNPTVEAMLVDDFIRGVSFQTIHNKEEIVRLNKQLMLWRIFAVAGMAVAFLLVARWWSLFI